MWLNLSADQIKLISDRIGGDAEAANIIKILQRANGVADKDLIKVARKKYCDSSDDIEVDEGAAISKADKGVWVMSWLWLPDDEASDAKAPSAEPD